LTSKRPNPTEYTATERARQLRRDATDAESRLWSALRDRQLSVKFRRQFPFGPYILDFYCMERKLAIEVDGGQHFEPEGLRKDAERSAVLERSGLRIIRFTNREVLLEFESVVEAIRQVIDDAARDIPSP
jgi:very-short-patch-repair endonuclease